MNTADITNLVSDTEGLGSTTITQLGASPRTLTRSHWEPQLRRAALLVIVLLLSWSSWTAYHYISDIKAEMNQIKTNLGIES